MKGAMKAVPVHAAHALGDLPGNAPGSVAIVAGPDCDLAAGVSHVQWRWG